MIFTKETIQATRQWFAANHEACIADVLSGAVKVNDVQAYVQWQEECINGVLVGDCDHTFTFRQRATYIQSEECFPLLAKSVIE